MTTSKQTDTEPGAMEQWVLGNLIQDGEGISAEDAGDVLDGRLLPQRGACGGHRQGRLDAPLWRSPPALHPTTEGG